MKLAVSGKGGVGKTTFSSLLIRTLNQEGKKILAIDADPDANLAAGLGIKNAEDIVPVAEMEELVLERTGAQPGSIGGFFKLNPKVDDLPDALSAKLENIKLMRLGGVKKGGSGAKAVDKLIVVVEPGRRSIDTAEHIRKLAGEIGLNHIAVVGNKVRNDADEAFLKTHLNDFEYLGSLPYDDSLIEADLQGVSPFDVDCQSKEKVKELINKL
jgi:CO dehydrogenase maturation factor